MIQTQRVVLPPLYEKQHDAVFNPARFSVIEASTKAGKTFACLVWQTAECLQKPGEHWWVAPTSRVAKIAFKRAERMTKNIHTKVNLSTQEIFFPNGSIWWFRGSDNTDSLYGEDVTSCVIDEASRCKEGTWAAIRSTLTATRGKARIIGNVRGRRNWFWRLARRAQGKAKTSKGTRYHYSKLTAWDAVRGRVIARSEVADAQQDLPEDIFRELYLAESSDGASVPFKPDAVRAVLQTELAAGPAVAFGVDVAKKRDYFVIVGINAENRICEFRRVNQLSYPVVVKEIVEMCGNVRTSIDQTGVGEAVTDFCQLEMQNLFGFIFTGPSRRQLLDNLSAEVHQGTVGVLDGDMRLEIESFEYEWTQAGIQYRQLDGVHDDTVFALALALHAKSQAPRKDVSPGVIEVPSAAAGIKRRGW